MARAQTEVVLQSRNELISILSHDLKHPLTAIQGSAQILGRLAARNPSLPAERVIDDAKRIDRAAPRIQAMLDELLDTARLQSGRAVELRSQPVDLVTLLKSATDECQKTSALQRIRLEIAVGELVGNWDESRLQRVIANLLSNAVKYSPAGGEVTVRLDGEVDARSARAIFSVADNGIGIPAAEVQASICNVQNVGAQSIMTAGSLILQVPRACRFVDMAGRQRLRARLKVSMETQRIQEALLLVQSASPEELAEAVRRLHIRIAAVPELPRLWTAEGSDIRRGSQTAAMGDPQNGSRRNPTRDLSADLHRFGIAAVLAALGLTALLDASHADLGLRGAAVEAAQPAVTVAAAPLSSTGAGTSANSLGPNDGAGQLAVLQVPASPLHAAASGPALVPPPLALFDNSMTILYPPPAAQTGPLLLPPARPPTAPAVGLSVTSATSQLANQQVLVLPLMPPADTEAGPLIVPPVAPNSSPSAVVAEQQLAPHFGFSAAGNQGTPSAAASTVDTATPAPTTPTAGPNRITIGFPLPSPTP
ncbi:MAG: sensor histidine kinase [Dehalococcoidia bacterium]